VNLKEIARFLRNEIRLKTFPVGAKFLADKRDYPKKTRQPSLAMGKRITICQAVTMARLYGWTVGISREDLICVPASLVFGFGGEVDPDETLAKLYSEINFHKNEIESQKSSKSMTRFEKGEYEALVVAPLEKGLYEPDTVVIFGNPAQVMRLVQSWTYTEGARIESSFGGKVECSEYLIAPFKSQAPRVVIPGTGDRVFSMTQDDEMVFALPGKGAEQLVTGLKEAGSKIGARYPVAPYQDFEPIFPAPYKVLERELDI